MKELNIFQLLNIIQVELNAPKSQYNSFGKYNYRSCEDILEALKPLLDKTKCVVTVKDEPLLIGDRYYIKAVAKIISPDGNAIEVSAIAREPLTKKGMDDAQITGSTSSYARKYALNGLFCIDDNRDPDHGRNEPEKPKPEPKKQPSKPSTPSSPQKVTQKQIAALMACANERGITDENIKKVMISRYGYGPKNVSKKDLTVDDYKAIFDSIKKKAKKDDDFRIPPGLED